MGGGVECTDCLEETNRWQQWLTYTSIQLLYLICTGQQNQSLMIDGAGRDYWERGGESFLLLFYYLHVWSSMKVLWHVCTLMIVFFSNFFFGIVNFSCIASCSMCMTQDEEEINKIKTFVSSLTRQETRKVKVWGVEKKVFLFCLVLTICCLLMFVLARAKS